IRHVDASELPIVRLTAVVRNGARPTLLEGGGPATALNMRELGSAEAIVLAVDNSQSMTGDPLREAKRAAAEFLAHPGPGTTAAGLVAFGHEALSLTGAKANKATTAETLASLEPDAQVGTALYDAVELSVSRLQKLSNGARVLVLLTDGRDLGSRGSLQRAIASAQRANVIVYAIAAGTKADRAPLAALTRATGGRLFESANATQLSATYRALLHDLEHTWQISYVTDVVPGDRVVLTVRAVGAADTEELALPGPSTS